jgi:hypothetical protein
MHKKKDWATGIDRKSEWARGMDRKRDGGTGCSCSGCEGAVCPVHGRNPPTPPLPPPSSRTSHIQSRPLLQPAPSVWVETPEP